MDEQDRRIYLLETLRTLDYQIIERKPDCEEVATLKQQREELRNQLNTLLPRVA